MREAIRVVKTIRTRECHTKDNIDGEEKEKKDKIEWQDKRRG